MGLAVKGLPATAGDAAPLLDLGRLLEKRMAAHPGALTWAVLWTEGPGRAATHRVAKSWTCLGD